MPFSWQTNGKAMQKCMNARALIDDFGACAIINFR